MVPDKSTRLVLVWQIQPILPLARTKKSSLELRRRGYICSLIYFTASPNLVATL